jgi:hypothetical protein
MALTFVLLFEYGRPLFRRLRRITALVMAEQKSIATQTEETPGVSSADRFVQTTTAYQTIKASSDNDGHVPFVFPPALPMVVPVVPMNMSQRSECKVWLRINYFARTASHGCTILNCIER